LVVQEAFDTSSCLTGSYLPSFTPSTTVMSGSLAGAVITTFLAPACRCFEVMARSRKTPVDSTTISTPISPQGSVAGSLAEHTRTSRPLTKIASPLAFTSAFSMPWTESCFSRWASVLASARSLTATTSRSEDSSAARKKTRPIRPNPFTPTRTAMGAPFPVCLGLSNTSGPRRTLIIASPGGEAQARLRAALDHPGDRQRPYFGGPALPEAAGALREGRPRRENIVHEEDVAARDQLRAAQPEGVPHVRPPGRGIELGLRRRGHRADQDIGPDRDAPGHADPSRQQRSLVEAALPLAARMQRHRHQQGRDAGRQSALHGLDQQRAERGRQSPPTPELE